MYDPVMVDNFCEKAMSRTGWDWQAPTGD